MVEAEAVEREGSMAKGEAKLEVVSAAGAEWAEVVEAMVVVEAVVGAEARRVALQEGRTEVATGLV